MSMYGAYGMGGERDAFDYFTEFNCALNATLFSLAASPDGIKKLVDHPFMTAFSCICLGGMWSKIGTTFITGTGKEKDVGSYTIFNSFVGISSFVVAQKLLK